MGHLQLVRTNGREVTPQMPARRMTEHVLHLPGLDLAAYEAMLTSDAEEDVLMRRDARVDSRRFVRNMRSRHPIAEVSGMCVWSLVGDLLCHVVPIAKGAQELADVASALRLVVRLVLDGEDLGAGMLVGGILLSIHGEGADRRIDLGMSTDDCALEMRLRLEDGSFVRLV